MNTWAAQKAIDRAMKDKTNYYDNKAKSKNKSDRARVRSPSPHDES